MNESLAQSLADRFDELGLRIIEPLDLAELPTRETVAATLAHGDSRAAYHVAHADPLTVSSNDWVQPHHERSERLLLVGPRVTERSAAMFRQLGIDYIDTAGNALIDFPGVHIDVRGRRSVQGAKADSPRMTRGGVNLFSRKRAQVIFALLSWPELLSMPVRQLATAAGASLGQTQETLELLTQYSYLDDRRELTPLLHDRLIDQWTISFPSGLGSAANTGRFSGEWRNLDAKDSAIYVGGEAAVPDLLRPETATLYTVEYPTEFIRARRWRRDDDHPNIFLRHRFWRSEGDETQPGIHPAPWLLVYADLIASNDARQREAAQQLRERHR
ncbi:type IV toxin-antitoxin system AbiEi family antitoxin [Microbacterium sp. SA39]|uniref:type IV toxin-antitoxin system AbiEi family antitoxin n=1 Tax=Microbacterium sp. SA39 TaxID=1263625 RepID=UPI00061FC150|nr:type IV toxin-antitoxin system AbiEi family antitoxin [Microbacterium sp. SA39]KJQ53260.1 hypothetical protein RS85_02774 [Microbacterium sp. SA39]